LQFRIYLFSLKAGELIRAILFQKHSFVCLEIAFFSIFKFQPPKDYGYELLENLKRLIAKFPKIKS
jgi:hypothetical protein